MLKTWKDVWNDRQLGEGTTVLSRVMAADGLDTPFGKVNEAPWRKHVTRTAALLGINSDTSVLEVGCGAGAYLLPLYEAGCDVAGLDQSQNLIEFATTAMPSGKWRVAAASDLDLECACDFVISSAVFLYFPSLEYASDVLSRMIRAARKGIMVLDVPDLSKRDEALAKRRQMQGEQFYAEKYKGLDHLYFDKRWFQDCLAELGMERVEIEDQCIDGYANSTFRFNVFAWRAGQSIKSEGIRPS